MWLNSHDPKWLSFKRPLTTVKVDGMSIDFIGTHRKRKTP